MSLILPPAASPLRNLFDILQLVELGTTPGAVRKLPTLRDAITQGRGYMAKDKAVKEMHYLILRADGSVSLVRIRRESQSERWNFGKI